MSNNDINIGHLSTTYHTNFILMGNQDLETELGKKISWKLFGTGPAMVNAFNNGDLDIGYMGFPPAIIGIDQGAPIKCIAGGHVEGTIMISTKNYQSMSQLNNNIGDVLAQFKGCTIGTPSRGSIHDVIINYYLEKYHLQDDIELKNYRQAELIGLDMRIGVVDGGVGTPALAVYAKTILKSHVVIPSKFLIPNNPSYGIFFSESLIHENPEIGRIFLKHHKNASHLLRKSKEVAANYICKSIDVLNNQEQFVKNVLAVSPKYCVALSKGYLDSTELFIDILHRLGYIGKKLKVEEFCDFQFVKELHPEEHHYNL
jgi:NitT/TauT family transport system substrate-binding protein